jgi:hypothetical protein
VKFPCKHCGRPTAPAHVCWRRNGPVPDHLRPHAKYCSPLCRRRVGNAFHRVRRKEEREVTRFWSSDNPALQKRLLKNPGERVWHRGAHRDPATRRMMPACYGFRCERCYKLFPARRPEAKYCSGACKQAAYRDRHR